MVHTGNIPQDLDLDTKAKSFVFLSQSQLKTPILSNVSLIQKNLFLCKRLKSFDEEKLRFLETTPNPEPYLSIILEMVVPFFVYISTERILLRETWQGLNGAREFQVDLGRWKKTDENSPLDFTFFELANKTLTMVEQRWNIDRRSTNIDTYHSTHALIDR